jgi:hypothetical protein
MRIDILAFGSFSDGLIALMTLEALIGGYRFRRHGCVTRLAFADAFHMTVCEQLVCCLGL